MHGTGSSTLGSFGDLQVDERDLWSVLERHFTAGIYAFEHRTLSESPIENALSCSRRCRTAFSSVWSRTRAAAWLPTSSVWRTSTR
jgi:hypothetical protein